MKTLTIILPFPLPTWNRILAMHHWERKKFRDLTDQLVSRFIPKGTDARTQTAHALSTSSTVWLVLEYYKMIRPNMSPKSLDKLKKELQDYK